mgnify:CR=1 FL=1
MRESAERRIALFNDSREISESTRRKNESILRSFFERVGKDPRDVTPADVMAHFAALRAEGASYLTRRTHAEVLKTFFRWMHLVGEIPADRLAALEEVLSRQVRRRERATREPVYLTDDEIRRMVSACVTEFERVAIPLLLATGLRVSELVSLRVRDVEDPERGVIRVAGKGGVVQRVRILEAIPGVPARSLLLSWMAKRGLGKDDRIFPYTPRHVQKVVRRVAERAGINKRVTPHALRHTTAVWMLNHGASIELVRRQLRHAKITTTQVYTAIADEDYLRQTEKFAKSRTRTTPRPP